MFLVAAAWSFSAPTPHAAEEELRRALLKNDARHGRLQHVRLHMSRRGARGVLFVSAEDGSSAEAYARTLWAAVALGEGPVSNWLLLECSALPLPAEA